MRAIVRAWRRARISEEEALQRLRRSAPERALALRESESNEQDRRERVRPNLDHCRCGRDRSQGTFNRLHRMIGRACARDPDHHQQQDEEKDEDDERQPLAQPLNAQHAARIAPTLAQVRPFAHDARVALFLLIGQAPLLLLFTLALALYLTAIELRQLRPHWKWWVWWLLLVALTHFVGYLALRIYVAYRRWYRARA